MPYQGLRERDYGTLGWRRCADSFCAQRSTASTRGSALVFCVRSQGSRLRTGPASFTVLPLATVQVESSISQSIVAGADLLVACLVDVAVCEEDDGLVLIAWSGEWVAVVADDDACACPCGSAFGAASVGDGDVHLVGVGSELCSGDQE